MVSLMAGEFHRLIRVGNYVGAMKLARREENPIKRAVMITEVVERSKRREFLGDLIRTVEEIKDAYGRAIAESYAGRAFYAVGDEEEAELRFKTALELSNRVGTPWKSAEVLGVIAGNLVEAGLYSEGLKCYRRAIDLLQASRALYSETVSVITRLAEMVERSGDETPNETALKFYDLAAGLYRSINFNLQAREIEEKKNLCLQTIENGSRTIADLLNRGEVVKAIEVSRFLKPAERCLALLNISYWLFLHNEPRLARETFKMAVDDLLIGKFSVPDVEVEKIAYKLLRIGRLEEPLILAGMIRDDRKAAEILGEVAVGYARRGEAEKALSIASGIKNEEVRNRSVEEIMRLRT
ncbi:MAG: tetratricopeptide repeat protein [Thermococci archaeon]|nr:tetratricopeptide repeat protein [Thermococci archaeon]